MRRTLTVLFLAASGLALATSPIGLTACGKVSLPVSAASPGFNANGEDGETDESDGLDDHPAVPPPVSPAVGAAAVPTKIRYVMVLIKENHTFDNYFTGFPGAESAMKARHSDGTKVERPEAPNTPLPLGICHSNSCGERAYAAGEMNGFDLSPAGDLPFYRYTEAQIPNYWQYGRNFVLADHYFSTTLGPSSPGHEVFWAGRSLSIDNAKCAKDGGEGCTGKGCLADQDTSITTYDPETCSTKRVKPCFDVPALPDHLPRGFTWSDYGGAVALMVKSVARAPDYATHFHKSTELVRDLEGGHLASLTIAHLSAGETSEHPPQFPCAGENFTVDIVNAAMKLPQWKEMAIVITWDDWGGFYDHVTPTVKSCPNGKVLQTGFRLPLLIVSPFAKKGFVLSTPAEQASVPRLVEELWGMPFMTDRDPRAGDKKAGSLMNAFDFDQPPRDPLILSTHACPSGT